MIKKISHIVWDTNAYHEPKRHKDWFTAVIIVSVGAVITALILKSFILALFCALAGGLIVYIAKQKPHFMTIDIHDRGITINGLLYPYDAIDAFWMYEKNPDEWHILLHIPRPMTPVIHIPIPEDFDPNAIYEILLAYIPEQELRQPLAEKFAEKIGF